MKVRLFTRRNGFKQYLRPDGESLTTVKFATWVVSEKTSWLWMDYEVEPLSEAEMMERVGATRLPGLE